MYFCFDDFLNLHSIISEDSHFIFFSRERIPQYRYTRRSVFLQIPITFIHKFLICPIPAFNLISVYHYSQHWANFVSNNTDIAEYIKIQALKVSCFQFVSNSDFRCEGSHLVRYETSWNSTYYHLICQFEDVLLRLYTRDINNKTSYMLTILHCCCYYLF